MRKKIVYIVSDIEKSIGMEWVISSLKPRGNLHVILIGGRKSSFVDFLNDAKISYKVISDDNFQGTFLKLAVVTLLLIQLRPLVVHCHLWRANLIGLFAAWLTRVPNRFYTRHHAMIHYREFPKGRKWDILNKYFSTKVVAISESTKKILIELDKISPDKVVVIHHGFDLNYFTGIDSNRVERLKIKYQLNGKIPVIGVIARYLEWKGIHFTIAAFKKLRTSFPSAHLLLANANGNYSDKIKLRLKELPPDSFTEIQFEEDLGALYQLMDVHVHVPIDVESEAFGQTYVEALVAGIPSIFTLSGIAPEFIRHEENALVVPFGDAESIYQAMNRILNEPELKNRIIANGKRAASQFSLSKMIGQLEKLYSK